MVDRQMTMIRSNLALVESFFQRWHKVLEWEPPLAGTIAFPRLLTGLCGFAIDVGVADWPEKVLT